MQLRAGPKGGGVGLLCHQSRPREEERAGPRSCLGQSGPEFRVRRPQGGGRGRRCSDRLREEEEPLELFGPFWTEFGAATSGRRREAAAFPIGPREEEGTCRIT